MHHPKSILERHQKLSDVESPEGSLSPREQAKVRKLIAKIAEYAPIVEQIQTVLRTQRTTRLSQADIKDIRPYSDVERDELLARLPHRREFFAQRAFSLPTDYRVPEHRLKDQNEYQSFVGYIVIQPEFLSDELLLSLGLFDEEDTNLGIAEKIEKKIALIPEIKSLLKGLEPLRFGQENPSERISRVGDPNHPNFGGYIVFGERTRLEEKTGRDRKKARQVYAHFYRDHYSLIRSQRYAIGALSSKIELLGTLRSETLPGMLARWNDASYTEDERKDDIARLEEILKPKLSFHEQRALIDRIQKIGLRHKEQDRQRIIGACNDMIRGIEEKIGKQKEIRHQAELLRQSERLARRNFERYFVKILRKTEEIASVFQGLDPKSLDDSSSIEGVQTHKLNQLYELFREFYEQTLSLPNIGAPFHEIAGVLKSALDAMNAHRKSKGGAIGKHGLHITLSTILKLKRIRYDIFLAELEYREKVRGDGLSDAEKEKILLKTERVRDEIQSPQFLPSVELTPQGKQRFETMLETLVGIVERYKPTPPSSL